MFSFNATFSIFFFILEEEGRNKMKKKRYSERFPTKISMICKNKKILGGMFETGNLILQGCFFFFYMIHRHMHTPT